MEKPRNLKAVIDIGSNSILMVIAELDSAGKIQILKDECRVCGLAKKLDEKGRVSPMSFSKAVAALREYRQILESYNLPTLEVLATESLRRPSNGEQIREELSKIIKQPIEIISGEREAELSFFSVQKDSEDHEAMKVVFDIGGASTEVVLGNQNGIQSLESLPIGSVTITEKFKLDSPQIPQAAIEYLEGFVKETRVYSEIIQKNLITRGIGVAGTMTSLIAVDRQIEHFSKDLVHHQKISGQRTKEVCSRVLSHDMNGRKNIIGLPFDRADVFGGGLCILIALINAFHWSEVECMDAGVRIGRIFELFEN